MEMETGTAPAPSKKHARFPTKRRSASTAVAARRRRSGARPRHGIGLARPHAEQNLSAAARTGRGGPVPSRRLHLAAANRIAEIAGGDQAGTRRRLSNHVPQESVAVATGVEEEPVASDLKARTPRAKRDLVALRRKARARAPNPALATNGIIADAIAGPAESAATTHSRSRRVRERRPRPTAMALHQCPAPTMSTRAAVHAKAAP